MSTTADQDRIARVALARLARPGHVELGALIDAVGAAETLDHVVAGDVSAALRRATSRQLAQLDGDPRHVAEQLIGAGEASGARLVVPGEDEWPDGLSDLSAVSGADEHSGPPLCLWVRGDAPLRIALDHAVAIAGTRAATAYGVDVATKLAGELAGQGWTVLSCTSSGIGAAAHRGAISAAAGRSTSACVSASVLPGGIDVRYPRAGAALVDTIADHGLLITERPPGTTVWPYRFGARDRLIASLTRGIVVVEAEVRSGARSVAEWGRRLDRVVMAVPGPVLSELSAGPHAEIADRGARLVTSAAAVVKRLGAVVRRPAPAESLSVTTAHKIRTSIPAAPPPEQTVSPAAGVEGENGPVVLDPMVRRVLDAVPADRPVPLAGLAAQAGLSRRELRRVLPELVLGGLVHEVRSGYRRASV